MEYTIGDSTYVDDDYGNNYTVNKVIITLETGKQTLCNPSACLFPVRLGIAIDLELKVSTIREVAEVYS